MIYFSRSLNLNSFSLDAPSITLHPANTTTTEGQNVTLACNATGNPSPSITWYKDGQLVIISGRFTQDSSSLTITKVSRFDEGTYFCNATNDVNSRVSNSTYLTVDCKYTVLEDPC